MPPLGRIERYGEDGNLLPETWEDAYTLPSGSKPATAMEHPGIAPVVISKRRRRGGDRPGVAKYRKVIEDGDDEDEADDEGGEEGEEEEDKEDDGLVEKQLSPLPPDNYEHHPAEEYQLEEESLGDRDEEYNQNDQERMDEERGGDGEDDEEVTEEGVTPSQSQQDDEEMTDRPVTPPQSQQGLTHPHTPGQFRDGESYWGSLPNFLLSQGSSKPPAPYEGAGANAQQHRTPPQVPSLPYYSPPRPPASYQTNQSFIGPGQHPPTPQRYEGQLIGPGQHPPSPQRYDGGRSYPPEYPGSAYPPHAPYPYIPGYTSPSGHPFPAPQQYPPGAWPYYPAQPYHNGAMPWAQQVHPSAANPGTQLHPSLANSEQQGTNAPQLNPYFNTVEAPKKRRKTNSTQPSANPPTDGARKKRAPAPSKKAVKPRPGSASKPPSQPASQPQTVLPSGSTSASQVLLSIPGPASPSKWPASGSRALTNAVSTSSEMPGEATTPGSTRISRAEKGKGRENPPDSAVASTSTSAPPAASAVPSAGTSALPPAGANLHLASILRTLSKIEQGVARVDQIAADVQHLKRISRTTGARLDSLEQDAAAEENVSWVKGNRKRKRQGTRLRDGKDVPLSITPPNPPSKQLNSSHSGVSVSSSTLDSAASSAPTASSSSSSSTSSFPEPGSLVGTVTPEGGVDNEEDWANEEDDTEPPAPLDPGDTGGYENVLAYWVRRHIRSLLKIRSNLQLSKVPQLTDEEHDAFQRGLPEAPLCSIQEFRFDFLRGWKKSCFNMAALDIAARDFIEAFERAKYTGALVIPRALVTEDSVQKVISTYAVYLGRQYRLLQSPTCEEKSKAETEKANIRARRETLYTSRVETLDLRPRLKHLAALLSLMTPANMSEDELEGPSHPPVYKAHPAEWQSDELRGCFGVMDGLKRKDWEIGTHQGNPPRNRITEKDASVSHPRAPKGLPINCYNPQFLNGLHQHQLKALRINPIPIDLTIPVDIDMLQPGDIPVAQSAMVTN